MRHLLLLPFLAALLLSRTAAAAPLPQPPCAPGDAPYPAYAAEGALPAVEIWQDIALPPHSEDGVDCFGVLVGPMTTVAALSGRFRFAGTLDDLAARFGAISQSVGQLYWSTTDQEWRELISEAFALSGNDPDLPRPDFTAEEVRSGATLYFAQNDTRSSGLNLYRLRAWNTYADRLTVEVVNESPVSFTFMTLFNAEGLLSLHFFDRLEGDLWGYYALAAVRPGSVTGHTKSLVNRAGAFYRFLRGVPGDAGPPLAK